MRPRAVPTCRRTRRPPGPRTCRGSRPAFIDVGSAETFRDEAVSYASRLWQAGGVAELHVWPGVFHAFAGFVPGAAISQDSVEAPARWLRRLLANLA